MMAAAVRGDTKMEPTGMITFRSDGYADEAIEKMKKEALLNDGVRLSKSAAIRKALISYAKKITGDS